MLLNIKCLLWSRALAVLVLHSHVMDHQSQPSQGHEGRTIGSRQGKVHAAKRYVRLVTSFSNAQAVVQFFVLWKKGDFWGVTTSAVRGESALLRLMSSQFSVFLMHKTPLSFQHLNHFPFWSRYKQEGCLGFILWDVCGSLQRRRTYKLVHSFEGPTGFWDPLLIDHDVLSGNTSVIFTRSDQQMKSPLPSTFCSR